MHDGDSDWKLSLPCAVILCAILATSQFMLHTRTLIMAHLGKFNRLKVLKSTDFGVYLDAENLGEILLPRKECPRRCNPGDTLTVFIYRDSEDRLIATTTRPLATVGQFACLKVVNVGKVGAFLDWGLPKDLLVPFREQKTAMVAGTSYVVYVYLDQISNRISASSQLSKFLRNDTQRYRFKQEVDLLIAHHSELGYNAIVDSQCWGLIHRSDAFLDLQIGQSRKGYIKKVRADGKLDLYLQQPGGGNRMALADTLLDALRSADGFIAVHDRSPPSVIYDRFKMSKKAFKQAIGSLYKKKLITIADDGIRLK